MDLPEDPFTFAMARLGPPPPDPPGWVDGAPTNGIGQSCAFCGDRRVAWVHPLARDLVAYRQYGEGHTLPTFWVLCDRCEGIHASGNEDEAVEVMRSSVWSWAEEDVAECIRQPLAAFRRADLGSRRLDPEPPPVVEARKQGFVPVRELTGVGEDLGPLWPSEHRLWMDALGAAPGEDEHVDVLDRWLVRSPWPSLSTRQTINALWRFVERDPYPQVPAEWKARVLEFFAWTEPEALAFLNSES